MYLAYFGFKQKPFQINTDPSFLWLGEKHMEALSTLRYGILDNKGFLLLTGDVGTGKTTLINALLTTLDNSVFVATIRDPNLEVADFFHYLSYEFGLNKTSTKIEFLIEFEKFLLKADENDKKVLLIIDEAQRINQTLLEEVRLLSNIEKHDDKLLNIFFVGQSEFNDILLNPINRPIRQRITINYNIETLTEQETTQYIRHRLSIAKQDEKPQLPLPGQHGSLDIFTQELMEPAPYKALFEIFTKEATREVFKQSQGYPRLINIICDRALLTGFADETKVITSQEVKDCAKELTIPSFHSSNKKPVGQTAYERQERDVVQHKNNNIQQHQITEIKPIEITPLPANDKKQLMGKIFAAVLVILIASTIFLYENPAYMNKLLEINFIQQIVEKVAPEFSVIPENTQMISSDKDALQDVSQNQPNTNSNRVSVEKTDSKLDLSAVSRSGKNGQTVYTNQEALHNSSPPMLMVKNLTIPFPPDASLPPVHSLINLDRLAETLKAIPSYSVSIIGFTGNSEDEKTNTLLSVAKANATKVYLIAKGLDESKIAAIGAGSQNPIVPNDSPENQRANHRVEISIQQY